MITLDLVQFISLLLVMVLLFLGFKVLEQKWSYRIGKPHKWDEAIENGEVPTELKRLEKAFQDKVRFYTFWFQIERIKREKIPGAFAELGVYKGETAKIIHSMNSSVQFHLFDTFEGFDQKDLLLEKGGDEKFSASNFSDTSLENVKSIFTDKGNVHFHPGYFPDSTKDLEDQKFAFVHLDADLYKPTLAALKYFYPRLSPGAVILIHDYNHNWEGLRKAVDEFANSIPEKIIEIPDWQGSAMILKNSVSETYS